MMPKPARWAVNPAMVAPSWRWAWRGLVGCLPMWEASALTLYDVTGGSATYGGGATEPVWDIGLSGLNVEFNDTDQRFVWKDFAGVVASSSKSMVVVADPAVLGTEHRVLTLYQAANTSNFVIWGDDTAGTDSWAYAYRRTGDLYTAVVSPYVITLSEDRTYVVALVQDGTSVKFYVDGVLVDSKTDGAAPSSPTATASVLARHTGGTENWRGRIYAAYVYDRPLSAAEVEAFARDPFGPIRPAGTLIVPLVEQGTLHSGAGVANSSLQMVGAGTLTLILLYATADGTINSVVNEVDTTVNLYASVDDSPSSPTDTDWINNTAGTGSVFLDLTNMPSDFGTMDTLKLTVRWRGQTYIGNKSIYAQIFQSNETTSMSDEVLVATATGDSSFANTTQVTFTGLDTSSGKSVWDGARIRLRWA